MKEKDIFEKEGFVVLREFVTPEELSVLSGIIDPIFRQWRKKSQDEIIEQNLLNMHSLTHPDYFQNEKEERIRFFNALVPPKLTTLIDRMFGEGIYFHNTQLFFNPFDMNKWPHWHRDLQYSANEDPLQAREQSQLVTLHIRIPLVQELGVELIPGTHARWDTEVEREVRLETNGHLNGENLPGATLIAMCPGDILIFSGQMIHRGNYRRNTARQALDLCVGKYHPFTTEFLDVHNLPHDEEMEHISNNGWYKKARALKGKN